jgi:hypothetical protein
VSKDKDPDRPQFDQPLEFDPQSNDVIIHLDPAKRAELKSKSTDYESRVNSDSHALAGRIDADMKLFLISRLLIEGSVQAS